MTDESRSPFRSNGHVAGRLPFRWTVLLLLVAAFVPAHGAAQDTSSSRDPLPRLNEGSRVRVLAPYISTTTSVTGRVLFSTPDALGITRTADWTKDSLHLTRADVTRIQVTDGRSHFGGMIKGVGLGALVGGAVGATVGIMSGEGSGVAAGFMLGAFGGIPIGAVVGLVRGSERWRTQWEQPY